MFFLILFSCSASHAQGATPEPLPNELVKIQAKYKKSGTLIAKFNQTTLSALTQVKKQSAGVISVKRPNKFRWETQTPDPSILVTDGRLFWFYTPPFEKDEHGQLIIRKTAKVQSRLASALLTGSFEALPHVHIEKKSSDLFFLKPAAGTAGDITEAQVFLNSNQNLIEKVILKHTNGNQAEIALSQIHLGKNLADEVFHFAPVPPKTDVIRQ